VVSTDPSETGVIVIEP
jgi:deubiquitinase DESI2